MEICFKVFDVFMLSVKCIEMFEISAKSSAFHQRIHFIFHIWYADGNTEIYINEFRPIL